VFLIFGLVILYLEKENISKLKKAPSSVVDDVYYRGLYQSQIQSECNERPSLSQ
jgi:hypothetical protein